MNDAVLESVTCGNTQVDSRNAHIVLNRMSKPDTKTGQTGYEEQFTVGRDKIELMKYTFSLIRYCSR